MREDDKQEMNPGYMGIAEAHSHKEAFEKRSGILIQQVGYTIRNSSQSCDSIAITQRNIAITQRNYVFLK